MKTFKRILCPVDFSKPSYEALKMAGDLARHFSSRLYMVHVVTTIPAFVTAAAPAPGMPFVGLNKSTIARYIKEFKKDAQEALQKLVNKRFRGNKRVTTVVKYGNPAEEILRLARDRKVDLIVIATHGETGFKRFLFGSVAEKVVRMSSCPVLTIRVAEKKH